MGQVFIGYYDAIQFRCCTLNIHFTARSSTIYIVALMLYDIATNIHIKHIHSSSQPNNKSNDNNSNDNDNDNNNNANIKQTAQI